ncbi:MAG: hypothetical protein QOK11_2455 [Pseudonocardiales bacterium]|nr:hypothetical protein [Pseudonocardiales bacterium]
MDRTSLVRVAVSLVVGTSFLVPLAAPADADATSATSASKRTIVDSPSGETLYVTNDGNCANVSVREEASSAGGFNDVGVTHELSYGLDNACHVVVLFSSTTKSIAMASTASATLETASATGGAGDQTASAASQSVAIAASCGYWGNVVHGSQTLQDVINIDIGKYRYGHDRNWNACSNISKFIQWWMADSTSVGWNHPNTPVIDGYDSAWHTYAANGYGHGSFHSDFLWCNFQAGQNYNMYTNLVSYASGSYNAHFSQSRVCSGTHMATAKKADLTRAAW